MLSFQEFVEDTAESRDEAVAKLTDRVQEGMDNIGQANTEEVVGRAMALAITESMRYADFRLAQYHDWLHKQDD